MQWKWTKDLRAIWKKNFPTGLKTIFLPLTVADAVKFPTGPFMESGRDFEVVANLPHADFIKELVEGVLGGKKSTTKNDFNAAKEASDRMWSSRDPRITMLLVFS